ncbi:hypothetical protein [Plantactinospora endophytica]|nr:hypothetical protein [Plantactinospora endophytica]
MCYVWEDHNTHGELCEGWGSGSEFRATARCKNGQMAYGNWYAADTFYGTWSYAYCSAKGGLADGWFQLR